MTSLSKVEISYIRSSLLSNPPLRADGRTPEDFRPIVVETGVAPLANGSARVSIGQPRAGRGHGAEGAGGGTEVVAAVKLEVDGVGEDEEGGKVVCSVSCSPAAYPHLTSPALDDLQSDLTSLLGSVLSHPSLCPKNLVIVPGKKAWALRLDTIVFADAGNVVDCLMIACRAALVDTRVPSTRSVEYRAPGRQSGTLNEVSDDIMDVDQGKNGSSSMLETRNPSSAVDFELADYWDEGEVLEPRDAWPVCVTLNMLPTIHFLDATSQEETAVPLRLHAMFAFPGGKPTLHGMKMAGAGTSDMTQIGVLLKHAEKYARNMWTGLEAKLAEEEARRSVKAREKFYDRRRR
ncbi:ribosomal protein S5 domain 2-like protein [Pisolithus thermaeus]|nr:ribosomal protein S5 domain 2-like protein [Pisolithus thermaeus]